jgi:hypothetical protein
MTVDLEMLRKTSQDEHTIDTYRRYLISHKADRKRFSYSSRSGSWPALPPKVRPVRKRAGLSLWKKSMLYSKKKNQTCMKKRCLTALKEREESYGGEKDESYERRIPEGKDCREP